MDETPSGQLKRRYERIAAGIAVRISSIEPERDPWTGRPFFRSLQETCENVSRGGVFVKTAEPLEAIGRVAWVKRTVSANPRENQAGVGIEFLGGASEHFEALEAYINHRTGAENSPD